MWYQESICPLRVYLIIEEELTSTVAFLWVAGTNAKGGTTIERQVAPVLTPGTLLDDGMLEGSCNNFLVAILTHSDENGMWGLAFSDISTGT